MNFWIFDNRYIRRHLDQSSSFFKMWVEFVKFSQKWKPKSNGSKQFVVFLVWMKSWKFRLWIFLLPVFNVAPKGINATLFSFLFHFKISKLGFQKFHWMWKVKNLKYQKISKNMTKMKRNFHNKSANTPKIF